MGALRLHAWAAMVLFATAAFAQEPTARRIESPPRLRVGEIPMVLDDDQVARHLDTGLTSSFLLTARVRDHRTANASLRIDVRYDLWDEVFVVSTSDPGRAGPFELASREALEEWWRGLELDIPNPPETRSPARHVEVELTLVPFSEAERVDAEIWYSGSARSEEASASRRGGDLGGILELVMSTAIRREAVVQYHWRVAISAAGGRDLGAPGTNDGPPPQPP